MNQKVRKVSISNDGSTIIATGIKSGIVLLDNVGESIWEYNTTAPILSLSLSTNATNFIAGSSSKDPKIYYFDRDNSKPIWNDSLDRSINTIAISKDGELFISPGKQLNFNVYHLDSNARNGGGGGNGESNLWDPLFDSYGPIPLFGYVAFVLLFLIVGLVALNKKGTIRKQATTSQEQPQTFQRQQYTPQPIPNQYIHQTNQQSGQTNFMNQVVQPQQTYPQQPGYPQPPAQQFPITSQSASPDQWQCPQCSNMSDLAYAFCMNCGYKR